MRTAEPWKCQSREVRAWQQAVVPCAFSLPCAVNNTADACNTHQPELGGPVTNIRTGTNSRYSMNSEATRSIWATMPSCTLFTPRNARDGCDTPGNATARLILPHKCPGNPHQSWHLPLATPRIHMSWLGDRDRPATPRSLSLAKCATSDSLPERLFEQFHCPRWH